MNFFFYYSTWLCVLRLQYLMLHVIFLPARLVLEAGDTQRPFAPPLSIWRSNDKRDLRHYIGMM